LKLLRGVARISDGAAVKLRMAEANDLGGVEFKPRDLGSDRGYRVANVESVPKDTVANVGSVLWDAVAYAAVFFAGG
jgi:hypothetical protein